jgi:hypothetical protein
MGGIYFAPPVVIQGGMANIGRFVRRPGVDNPRNLVEFNEFFATEDLFKKTGRGRRISGGAK